MDPEFLTSQFNVAAALLQKDDPESNASGHKIVMDIHQRFPDYVFARIAIAQFAIEDRRLEEAQELLKALMYKKQWQVSEYKAYASVQTELAIARRDFTAARNSLGLLKQFRDSDARINRMEKRIAQMELQDRTLMMRQKS